MEENDVDIKKIPDLVWTPVRTKPRREKKLADYCRTRSVAIYLPLRKSVKRYKRRTAEFMVPMFPGYVFCALDEEKYAEIVQCGAIVYRVKMTPELETRLIEDLIALRDFERMTRAAEVVVRPEIVEGVRVKVCSGPLRGVTGVVEQRKDRIVLSVGVEILGQSVSTKLDIEDVELED
jgi:transcriptional antiterminator RfaH